MIINIVKFIEKNQTLIIHAAALIIFGCGIIYSILLGDELRFPDERNYYTYAQNLVKGLGYTLDGVHPSSWRTPGYPVFLSGFVFFGAKPVFLRCLNFLALAACLYVIRSILRRAGAESGAAVSAILLMGYGVLFYTAGTLYPQTLFALFLLFLFRLAISRNFSYSKAVLFGLVGAILIMLHPTAIFIPPLMVLCMFFPNRWAVIPKGIISGLVIIICFTPWVYRNYLIYDAFIPISAHGGDTLYLGNNPNTSVNAWYESYTDDISETLVGMSEVEQDRFFKKKVYEFWKDHPKDAITLYAKKFLHHFNFQNKYYVRAESSNIKSIIMFVTYYPLLLCLLARLFFIKKFPLNRMEYQFIVLYVVSGLFHAIFLTRIRFRLPYDVLLITHIGLMFSLFSSYVKQNMPKPRSLP